MTSPKKCKKIQKNSKKFLTVATEKIPRHIVQCCNSRCVRSAPAEVSPFGSDRIATDPIFVQVQFTSFLCSVEEKLQFSFDLRIIFHVEESSKCALTW